MPTLEEEFTAELIAAAHECAEFGYHPRRFLQMLHEHGGVKTAKELVRSSEEQSGLKRLKSAGRLDLSMEAIMLNSKYRSLFTKGELQAAEWRLNRI